jgi:hypothetical protein
LNAKKQGIGSADQKIITGDSPGNLLNTDKTSCKVNCGLQRHQEQYG